MSTQSHGKKVVSRRVTIGLGIICIVLLGSLVGTILFYSSTINNKDSQITELNQQITTNASEHSTLSSQLTDLTGIVNLAKSVTWVDSKTVTIQANYAVAWNATANYAGYVSVEVYSAITGTTYVRVTWSSHGVNYDSDPVDVGGSGTTVFPVLPATIQISVGNPSDTAGNATVTVVYYY